MRIVPVVFGGLCAGMLIVLGELPLNTWLLGDAWASNAQRLGIASPEGVVALQLPLKLVLLGVFGVWLSEVLEPGPADCPICGRLIRGCGSSSQRVFPGSPNCCNSRLIGCERIWMRNESIQRKLSALSWMKRTRQREIMRIAKWCNNWKRPGRNFVFWD